MSTPPHHIALTTASGSLLHDVHFQPTAELDHYERQRLFGIEEPAKTFTWCLCGWSTALDDVLPRQAAVAHVHRDPALSVHRVGGHTSIGSRSLNADSYGSAVDDTTGVAAFAVADGIGSHPGSATAAAIATTTALPAALTAQPPYAAVRGVLAARDALTLHHDLIDGGDTVMVMAVSRPPGPHDSRTWDIAWVGDCRAYLVEGNLLTQLTTDHTVGERMRQQGRSEHLAAYNDNVVFTSVGTAEPVTLGKTTVSTEAGRLALVSDGVGKGLDTAVLHEVLQEISDPREAAEYLVEFGVVRPRADNATALVIDTHRL